MIKTCSVFFVVLGVCSSISNRTNCAPHDIELENRFNSTAILNRLRLEIVAAKLDALIVTSGDEHQNEYVAPSDERIEFISGFTGSAGTVVVTKTKALLWTDGRYHLQADSQLDCNWLLMRSGLPDVPTTEKWLKSEFPSGAQIGGDSKLIPATEWHELEKKLQDKNQCYKLVQTKKNLIDSIWDDKPQDNTKPAFVLDTLYAGASWQQKVNQTRQALTSVGVDAAIITALDEIAWLLNLRGYDVPHSPVVKSYVLLSNVRVLLFLEESKIPSNFSEVYNTGQENVRIVDYNNFWDELPSYITEFEKILVPSGFGFNPGASKRIYDLVSNEKRLLEVSPIINLKAEKNPTEIKWMEDAQLQDSVALSEFFEYLEKNYDGMTEVAAAKLLDEYRSKSKTFISLSFGTLVAYGEHSALPHYKPTPETDIKLGNESLLMVDSGGQYLGGTTDVTRTISIGIPTSEQKETYTRVLIGSIDLSSFVFPATVNVTQMDLLARAPLWEVGYDFLHGTGHGVGSFLLVHEAPISIGFKSKVGVALKPGYFTSIEPGFYLDGQFGLRLENVVRVIEKTDLKYKPKEKYLRFKTITLFPYDIKLIDFNLLSKKHIQWLKEYYQEILSKVGNELQNQKKISTYNWLLKQLRPFLGN